LQLSLIVFSCKDNSPSKPSKSNQASENIDSLEYHKDYERIFHEYNLFYEQIGFKPLDEYKLDSLNDRIYRIQMFEALGSKITVVEVSNKANKLILNYVKGKIDYECNPVNGTKKFSPECFIVESKYEKPLTQLVFDSIDAMLDEHEFWELSETSDKFKDDVIFDGGDWVLHVWYAQTSNSDGVETKRRSILRELPEYYPSIWAIGKYFEEVAKK